MPPQRIAALLLLICLPGICALPSWAETDEDQSAEDYQKLRIGFAESDTFNPIALQMLERKTVEKAVETWKEGKAGDATEMLYELLQHYPLSMEAHIRLADGYKLLLEADEAGEQKDYYENLEGKHRYVYEGLVESVMLSGDGKTPETAFEIISFGEEAWILREMGMLGLDRELNKEEKLVTYLTTKRDGTRHTVYFDVSRIIDGIERLRKKEMEEAGNAAGPTPLG